MTSTERRTGWIQGPEPDAASVPVPDDARSLADPRALDDAVLAALAAGVADPLAARRALREQIDRLSARLRRHLADEYAAETMRIAIRPGPVDGPGPRLLDLAELERVRDELVARIDRLDDTATDRRARFAQKRALLAAMYADPDRHRGVRVTQPEIGESGCTRWTVRPVLGVVGRLGGWWRVRMSSGCP